MTRVILGAEKKVRRAMCVIRLALGSGKSRGLKNRILRRKASEDTRAEHLSELFICACEYLSPHHRKSLRGGVGGEEGGREKGERNWEKND